MASQAKKTQETHRPKSDSTSSSSSSSATAKKTAPPPIPKNKRQLETKTPTSEEQAQKRPRVHSKSSSSSSFESEDEPGATTLKTQIQGPAAATRQTMVPNHDDSSSKSSSDDETAEFVRRKSTGAWNTTLSDAHPKISSVFSIKDTDVTAKPKSITKGVPPPARQNVFPAAAIPLKESVEPAARATSAKRKSMEETHNGANMEYGCKICGKKSDYKASIIRHLEIIHRVPRDKREDCYEIRERPISAMDVEEEEDEQSKTRNIASRTKNCLNCELLQQKAQSLEKNCESWQQKAQSLKKMLAKISTQITKANKVLEEEQYE